MSIEEAISQDSPEILEQAISSWDNIDQIITTSDNQQMTLLCLCLMLEKVNLSKYLISNGANYKILLGENEIISFVHLKNNLELYKAVIESGVEFDEIFLIQWLQFNVIEIEDIISERTSTNVNLIRQIGINNLHDTKKSIKTILKNEYFYKLYYSLYSKKEIITAVNKLSKDNTLQSKKEIREIDIQIEAVATIHAMVMAYSIPFFARNKKSILSIISRNFYGLKNDKKSWNTSYNKCVNEVSELISNETEYYSDDEFPIMVSELLVALIPIKSIIKGIKHFNAKDLTGIKYENDCYESLINNGYNCKLTSRNSDQGVDIIAQKNGINFAIQCKDISGSVGNSAVQEVIAGKKYYNTDYAVVCSSGKFTESAKNLASKSDVILCNIDILPLIDRLSKIFD